MIDLFMIALMILACVVGPADAKRLAIDYYDAKSGRAQTLHVERTKDGFLLEEPNKPGRKITHLGGGSYDFEMPGETLPKIDLSAALAVIERGRKEPITTFELEGNTVRLTRTPGLIYLREVGATKPLLVVRAEPRAGANKAKPKPEPQPKGAQALRIPPTKPGSKDFEGWDEYETHWEVFAHQAKAGLRGSHDSPAQAAVEFFTRLFRGDKDFVDVLSPKLSPKLREKIAQGLPERTRDLKRFIGMAKITKAKALELGKRPLGGIPQALEKVFGSYDVLMFGEGNTSRTDIFMVFEQVEGKWYVKGIGANFAEFLFKEQK